MAPGAGVGSGAIKPSPPQDYRSAGSWSQWNYGDRSDVGTASPHDPWPISVMRTPVALPPYSNRGVPVMPITRLLADSRLAPEHVTLSNWRSIAPSENLAWQIAMTLFARWSPARSLNLGQAASPTPWRLPKSPIDSCAPRKAASVEVLASTPRSSACPTGGNGPEHPGAGNVDAGEPSPRL